MSTVRTGYSQRRTMVGSFGFFHGYSDAKRYSPWGPVPQTGSTEGVQTGQ